MIRVIDEDHNVIQEVRSKLEYCLRQIFLRGRSEYTPQDLERRFQVARWSYQQLCAAAHFNYNQGI